MLLLNAIQVSVCNYCNLSRLFSYNVPLQVCGCCHRIVIFCIGDLWSYNRQRDIYIVSPEPDVAVFNIDGRQQRCLVIASDGVWNVMSPTDATDYISRWNRRSQRATVNVNSAHFCNEQIDIGALHALTSLAIFCNVLVPLFFLSFLHLVRCHYCHFYAIIVISSFMNFTIYYIFACDAIQTMQIMYLC